MTLIKSPDLFVEYPPLLAIFHPTIPNLVTLTVIFAISCPIVTGTISLLHAPVSLALIIILDHFNYFINLPLRFLI